MQDGNSDRKFRIRNLAILLILLSIGLMAQVVDAQEKAVDEEAALEDLREAMEPTVTEVSEPTETEATEPVATEISEPTVTEVPDPSATEAPAPEPTTMDASDPNAASDLGPVYKAGPLRAVVTSVSGGHAQYSMDKGKTWKPLELGLELGKDSLVRTGFGSSCDLRFGGHSVLMIQALSSVRVADYMGIEGKELVRARLHYGALRCGVEKGRIEADTRISTPVSTLSIRGTKVFVSYDAGNQSCMLGVDEDGPATARVSEHGCCGQTEDEYTQFTDDPNQQVLAFGSDYNLYEGMRTDCMLSRDLRLTAFDRAVWVTGNYRVGEISATEADTIVQNAGNIGSTEGARQYDDDKSIGQQKPILREYVFPGGDIPIGGNIPTDAQ